MRVEAAALSGTDDIPSVSRHAPDDVLPANRRTSGTFWRPEPAGLVPKGPHIFPWLQSPVREHRSTL